MKTPSSFGRAALALGAFLLVGQAALRAADNQLTAEEKAAGWQLLFDGRSFNGWRAFTGTTVPADKWKVENGTLHALKGVHVANDRKSDIITEKKYTDYEFSWEWKVSPHANSGIKYLVTESRPTTPGPEYQMLDERPAGAPRPDGKKGGGNRLTSTASFYEILAPAIDKPIRPAGEWNVSRVVVRGKDVEHWLNGMKVLAYNLDSPEVKAGIAKSKFKDEPGYGDKIPGHLMLTHHGDEAWFKNVKIREIK